MNLIKKLIFTLTFLSLPNVITIKANIDDDCSDGHCTTEQDYEGAIDCNSCCSDGRSASGQCLNRCNGCLMRNDEATSEYNDWPNSR